MFAMGVLLYIMLYGAHPFDVNGTATDEEIARRIRECQWGFLPAGDDDGLGGTFPALSESVQRVISRLLTQQPEERMTARELCDDPWFAEVGIHGEGSTSIASRGSPETPSSPFSSLKGRPTAESQGGESTEKAKSITLRRHSKKIITLKELVEKAPDDGGRGRLIIQVRRRSDARCPPKRE